jgi:hypothetical protein
MRPFWKIAQINLLLFDVDNFLHIKMFCTVLKKTEYVSDEKSKLKIYSITNASEF